jgi:hypothetical protein
MGRLIAGLIAVALLMGAGLATKVHASAGKASVVEGAADVAVTQAMAVVQRFYELHAPISRDGIPDDARLASYGDYLTADLLATMAAARATLEAKRDDDRPPMEFGSIFSSDELGYVRVHVLAADVDGDVARVRVELESDRPGATPATDIVVLRRVDAGWRIDDVEFGKRFATLRRQLAWNDPKAPVEE